MQHCLINKVGLIVLKNLRVSVAKNGSTKNQDSIISKTKDMKLFTSSVIRRGCVIWQLMVRVVQVCPTKKNDLAMVKQFGTCTYYSV